MPTCGRSAAWRALRRGGGDLVAAASAVRIDMTAPAICGRGPRDTGSMSRRPDQPPHGDIANHVTGGVSGNLVQTAAIHGDVHFHQQRRPVDLLHRAGVAPQRAAAFQDRPGTSRLLAQALGRGDAAVLTGQPRVHTGVVSGLGGIGKTQIALDYAERLWASGELGLWVWVTAGSREAIVSSYAQVAMDVTGVEDSDP